MDTYIPCSDCPVSLAAPARGRYILFCEHDIEKYTEQFKELHCATCKGNHATEITCEEFADMCDHIDDEEWWRASYLPEAHWHDSTPCWTYCAASHSHPGKDGEDPCYDTNCKPCPVCAGRMEPGSWSGYACSRECAVDYR